MTIQAHDRSFDAALASATKSDFEKLVKDLSALLGPSSGIDDVDVDEIKQIMRKYKSNEQDWGKYALSDCSRKYTRNLVDKGNGKSNLLVLVWTPGKGSPIHDHANAHCVMKILKGTLNETQYAWPNNSPPTIQKESTYHENEVTYISDKIGLHMVSNPHPTEFAVSLHLYTPPNAATNGCHVFDPKTGASRHVLQNYFSEYGQKVGNCSY